MGFISFSTLRLESDILNLLLYIKNKATKSQWTQIFKPVLNFIKRPQIKVHTDTTSDSKLWSQKKAKFIVRSKSSCSRVFVFINILLKLQQYILMCFCKFKCNSEI